MKSGSKRFTFELETGLQEDEDIIEVEVYITSYFTYERNYGADADGNRGHPVWWFDYYDYEIESCSKELNEAQMKELRDKMDNVAEDIDLD